jgi:hypothetical protein
MRELLIVNDREEERWNVMTGWTNNRDGNTMREGGGKETKI